MLRGLAVVIFLSGCQPSVYWQAAGPNRWTISVEGTKRTSSGEVLGLLHEKAAQLCPGSYDMVDSTSGSKNDKANGGIVVECRAVVQPAACTSPSCDR